MTHEEFNRLVVRADTNSYNTNTVHLLPGPLGRPELLVTTVTWAMQHL
jgi:hypothetical protein